VLCCHYVSATNRRQHRTICNFFSDIYTVSSSFERALIAVIVQQRSAVLKTMVNLK